MLTLAMAVGLAAGLLLGLAASVTGSPLLLGVARGVEPLGTLFMNAIQMVVIPLVVTTIFTGVASMADPRKLGKLGGAGVGFYWLTTLPAIVLGMAVMRIGLGFAPDVTIPGGGEVAAGELPGLVDFVVRLVPSNPVAAAAEGDLLPLIVFTALFAAAAGLAGGTSRARLVELAEAVTRALVKLVHWILWTAPVGVFALAAPVTAESGWAMLQNLAVFIVAVAVGLVVLVAAVYLPAVRFLGGMGGGRFLRGCIAPATIGFTTTSQVASLPVMIDAAEEELGVTRRVASLILALGASLNRAGTALFQGASVVFLASVYGVPFPASAVGGAVVATFLVAMTVAPVPSAGVVTLAPALDAVGVPAGSLGLLLGIDRIPDMLRSATNVVGSVAGAVVADAAAGDEERKEARNLQEPATDG